MIHLYNILQETSNDQPNTTQKLVHFISHNLANQAVIEVVSDKQFLKKIDIKLDNRGQIDFFIKNIFPSIRLPQVAEKEIIRKEIGCCEQSERKELLQSLLEYCEEFERRQTQTKNLCKEIQQLNNIIDDQPENCELLYARIKDFINNSTNLCKLTIILSQLTERLLRFSQDNLWQSTSFQGEIHTTILSLEQQFTHTVYEEQMTQQQQDYLYSLMLDIVAKIALLSIKNNSKKILVLFLILTNLFETIPKTTKILSKTINKLSSTVLNTLNNEIFQLYYNHYNFQTKHRINMLNTIDEIKSVCEIIYCMLDNQLQSDCGIIILFSIDKWLDQSIQPNQPIFSVTLSNLHQLIANIRKTQSNAKLLIQLFIDTICPCLHSHWHSQPILTFIHKFFSFLLPSEQQFICNTFCCQQPLLTTAITQLIDLNLPHFRPLLNSLTHQYQQYNSTTNSKHLIDSIKIYQHQQTLSDQQCLEYMITSSYSSQSVIVKHYQHYLQNLLDISMYYLKTKTTKLQVHAFFKPLINDEYFVKEYWQACEGLSIIYSCSQIETLIELFEVVLTNYFVSTNRCSLSALMVINCLLVQFIKKNIFDYVDKQHWLVLGRTAQSWTKQFTIDLSYCHKCIILQFIYQLFSIQKLNDRVNNSFQCQQFVDYMLSANKYIEFGRLGNLVERVILFQLYFTNQLSLIDQYQNLLPFYKKYYVRSATHQTLNVLTEDLNTLNFYKSLTISQPKSNFQARELTSQTTIITLLTAQTPFKNQILIKLCANFTFQSPLYKDQIIVLKHLRQNPSQNYFFRNHLSSLLNLQYLQIHILILQTQIHQNILPLSSLNQVYHLIIDLLTLILNNTPNGYTHTFYITLNYSRCLYILLQNTLITVLSTEYLQNILNLLIKTISKDNLPLLRQYIEVCLCRLYMQINRRMPGNKYRQQLVDTMTIQLNIAVPITLCLGYQLINSKTNPQQLQSSEKQHIIDLHIVLVKYICSHRAYLRGICQQYLRRYFKLHQFEDVLIEKVRVFWEEDKDCMKMLTNMSEVIDGFQEAVERQVQFVGFQRVEEYPKKKTKLEWYRTVLEVYGAIDELYKDGDRLRKECIDRRVIRIKKLYKQEYEDNFISCKTVQNKSNIKSKQPMQIVLSQKSKQNSKNKSKPKSKNKPNQPTTATVCPLLLLSSFTTFSSLHTTSIKLRTNPTPKIIILGTLLQKVHNFGHILRTLHNHHALLTVPCQQPLLHPQCLQLIPSHCDVQVIQLKPKDLPSFILMYKQLGYPLIALQQCSKSIMLQNVEFPQQFMLLLGNERLGASAELLAMADLLVEIPQVGKIRSLNVHVSMAICIWQYTSGQQAKQTSTEHN